MRNAISDPTRAAIGGSLLLLPLLIVNAIVANRIEPAFSMIRPGPHTSSQEYLLLAITVLLMPAGAYLAARPLLQRTAGGNRRFYAANALVAAILCLAFVTLCGALIPEIYRCDVLNLPNCD